MNEKEKYIDIYAGDMQKKMILRRRSREKNDGGYGRGCWGEGVIPFLKTVNPQSLCDVGCGFGRFCDMITDFIPNVYGCDIASVVTGNIVKNKKITFLDAEAKSIPLDTGTVEWVTSFDCLEHCMPEDIDDIFDEFKRISTKGMLLSISYRPDIRFGIPLHLTVQPETWWVEKLSNYGNIKLFGNVPITGNKYIKCVY